MKNSFVFQNRALTFESVFRSIFKREKVEPVAKISGLPTSASSMLVILNAKVRHAAPATAPSVDETGTCTSTVKRFIRGQEAQAKPKQCVKSNN